MIIDKSLREYISRAEQEAPEVIAEIQRDMDYRDSKVVADIAALYVKHGLVDLAIPTDDVTALCLAPRAEQIEMLAEHLIGKSPALASAPEYCKRRAENIVDTQLMSLTHLAEALVEESQARFAVLSQDNDTLTMSEVAAEVLGQQLMAMDVFAELTQGMQDKSFKEVEDAEVAANQDTLGIISKKLSETAETQDIDVETNAEVLHREIANTWSMITSNRPFVTSDINYRAYSMKKPGASRGLFAYPNLPPHFNSSPIASYMTYTEVPVATDIDGEERSFGFLNLVNVDPVTGLGYVVERPHFMHSSRMLELADTVPGAKEKIFALDTVSQKNHDLWHHMVQVYADHFQIHHHSAPISNGGHLQPYTDFGRAMRQHREAYELAAATGHLEVFSHEEDGQPSAAMQKEMKLIKAACDATWEVCETLRADDRHAEADEFGNYVCNALLGHALLVLPKGSEQYATLAKEIGDLKPSPVSISRSDVIKVLDGQKLLRLTARRKNELVEEVLGQDEHAALRELPNVANWLGARGETKLKESKREEYVSGAFHDILPYLDEDTQAELLVRHQTPETITDGEYGANVLYAKMQELGLIGDNVSYPVTLEGIDAVGWNLTVGEIQPALWGYYDKIHDMPDVPYGDGERTNLFELALKQQEALEQHADVYKDRIFLRQASDLISHELLMLFVESYATAYKNPVPKWLDKLLENGTDEERGAAQAAIGVFDELLTAVAEGRTAPTTPEQEAVLETIKELAANDLELPNKRCLHRINQTIESYKAFVEQTADLNVGERGRTSKPDDLLVLDLPPADGGKPKAGELSGVNPEHIKEDLRTGESQRFAGRR